VDKHSIAEYLKYIGANLPTGGRGWRKMKCPFHDDSHASAAINYDENRFKCFGCGAQGDVYDLIMYRQGGNYIEAIQFAESISLTGNRPVRKAPTFGRRISFDPTSLGRRGQEF